MAVLPPRMSGCVCFGSPQQLPLSFLFTTAVPSLCLVSTSGMPLGSCVEGVCAVVCLSCLCFWGFEFQVDVSVCVCVCLCVCMFVCVCLCVCMFVCVFVFWGCRPASA